MAEEKKNTGKPKTSMFALVQAGKEEAKKVQSIKSVSSQQTSEEKIPEVQPAASTTEPAKVVAPVQEEEIIQENENMTEEPSEFPESSFPKGLSLLFAKREIIDTETIKIPREFHQELKILSTMPRLSKKAKQEWDFFINPETSRRTYNSLCLKCKNKCKQSHKAIVVFCPKYKSKRGAKSVKNRREYDDSG